MQKSYPVYRNTGRLDEVEKNLSPTNKRLVNEYLNFVSSKGCGDRKLKQYKAYFLQFVDIVGKNIDKLTQKDIEAFGSLVNKSDRSVPVKNQIKMTVKRFLKWHYKDTELLDCLKGHKIIVNREKINKATLLKPSEIEAIFRAADSFRDQAILSLLEESAGRPEEIRNCTWDKVSFENKTITFYSHKTKESRTIPIDNAVDRLEIWKKNYCFADVQDNDYLFPAPRDRTKPLSASFFTNMVKALAKKAGITRTIIPYTYRHTRLTELYNKKVGDLIHRKYAGHSSDSKMTAVYVAMDDDDMIDAVRQTYKEDIPDEKKHQLQKEVENLNEVLEETLKRIEYLEKDSPKKSLVLDEDVVEFVKKNAKDKNISEDESFNQIIAEGLRHK